MRDRIRLLYRAWDEWSTSSGSTRGYFVVMTPALFLGAALFAWAGGWAYSVACMGLGLFGVYVLRRRS